MAKKDILFSFAWQNDHSRDFLLTAIKFISSAQLAPSWFIEFIILTIRGGSLADFLDYERGDNEKKRRRHRAEGKGGMLTRHFDCG